ncbi:putative peptidase [Synechocystis sp. LKSZ1]
MSASSLVLSHRANATTSTETETATTTLAKLSLSSTPEVPSLEPKPPETIAASNLAPPSLKYQVRAGETIWQISQDFHLSPELIAATNQITTDTPLVEGQTLKIPSTTSRVPLLPLASIPPLRPTLVSASPQSLPEPQRSEPQPRQVSSHSPVALASPAPEIQAEVADVSQPIQVIPAEAPVLSEKLQAAAQEAGISVPPAPAPISELNRPVPIFVPTPDAAILPPKQPRAEVTRLPAQSTPLPPVLATPPIPRKPESELIPRTQEPPVASIPQRPTVTAFNQPINIPVIPPETSTVRSQAMASPQLVPQGSSAPAATLTYQVKPGDTINYIARQHGLKPEAILRANSIDNPNLIQVNQTLVIPQHQVAVAPAPALPRLVTPTATSQSRTPRTTVGLLPDVAVQPTVTTTENPLAQETQRLKAEVAQLPSSSQHQAATPGAIPLTVEPASQESLDAYDINPQWNAQRQPSQSNRSLPRGFTAPRTALEQIQRNYGARSNARNLEDSQIVGAAPVSPEEYNDELQLPVGIEVSPEFPESPKEFTGYIWPAKGVLTSGFGRRWGRPHRGIDIAAPIGTPIMAAAPGEVIFAGWNSGGFGNLVKIRHADGSVTYYGHTNRVLVRTGELVQQGQQVAEMGSTGRSTGPHLHFEIRPDGKTAVNPIAMLPQRR